MSASPPTSGSTRSTSQAVVSAESTESAPVRDPLRNNISPLVTDVVANGLILLEVLQSVSGLLPAPPFLDTILSVVKWIVKTVQRVRLDKSRGLRLIRRVERLGEDLCAAVAYDPESVDALMARLVAGLLKALLQVYKRLEKYLTKEFVYRFVRYSKISDVIDGATETLDQAWKVFQFGSSLCLAQNVSRHGYNLKRLAIYDEKQYRLFHPGDIVCHRKIGGWPDDENPLGEEWEGVYLEKIPCEEWEDLRHERHVLVRKFDSEEQPGKDKPDPAKYVHALPVIWHPDYPQVLGYSHPLYDGERYYIVEPPAQQKPAGPDSITVELRVGGSASA
ncbi:uncharacterized protein C8Q71DRAFT_726531 [Rhodofomes roseus]|uniref:Mixed lineage kinase domain-containing protein n=1 Tax=Rhodofomes roseus TaxID=34475 RepID=A0ABQ8K5H2_9APHY|nr:uncharacterized protein C8Q71DRAFT_726531 [Rhodofomes roseus]KAH9832014.1 hypothetical protein C8Q71DRAFT_726531 [Rhodofomes roseus]